MSAFVRDDIRSSNEQTNSICDHQRLHVFALNAFSCVAECRLIKESVNFAIASSYNQTGQSVTV